MTTRKLLAEYRDVRDVHHDALEQGVDTSDLERMRDDALDALFPDGVTAMPERVPTILMHDRGIGAATYDVSRLAWNDTRRTQCELRRVFGDMIDLGTNTMLGQFVRRDAATMAELRQRVLEALEVNDLHPIAVDVSAARDGGLRVNYTVERPMPIDRITIVGQVDVE